MEDSRWARLCFCTNTTIANTSSSEEKEDIWWVGQIGG